MSHNSHPALLPRLPYGGAIAGLLGVAILFTPLASSAETVSQYRRHVSGKTAGERTETIDQRISSLHAQLQITPGEETGWNTVTQVMRENETKMQDMISAREHEPAHHVNALEDLRTYEHFIQAHADGLNRLRASFETFYNTLPDSQKLVADEAFAKFGNDPQREASTAH